MGWTQELAVNTAKAGGNRRDPAQFEGAPGGGGGGRPVRVIIIDTTLLHTLFRSEATNDTLAPANTTVNNFSQHMSGGYAPKGTLKAEQSNGYLTVLHTW
jgi:hypothetical protein